MLSAIRSAEWSHLRDYVSGAFFDVLPAATLAAEVGRLSRNTTRRRHFDARTALLAAQWSGLKPSIELQASVFGASLAARPPASGPERAAAGHATLVAFFRVVLEGGDLLMDLRPTRLSWHDGVLFWAPSRLWTTWSDEFGTGVAELYRGFYGDDPARFDAALRVLGLAPAGDVMRRHFGGDDQRAVSFDIATFHSTFHDVFVSCRDAGHRLDRGFVGLGLILACLYETLEGLGGTFDVRAAFDAAC